MASKTFVPWFRKGSQEDVDEEGPDNVRIALVAAAALPAQARTVTKDYIGSWDPLSPDTCSFEDDYGVNIGMVCFNVRGADRGGEASIRVQDTVNPEPGFFYFFSDAAGDCAVPAGDDLDTCDSAGFGCPTANVVVPENAVQLDVYPSGVVLGPSVCIVIGGATSIGAATAGTVTVVFD